jgi:hypothetical protein
MVLMINPGTPPKLMSARTLAGVKNFAKVETSAKKIRIERIAVIANIEV